MSINSKLLLKDVPHKISSPFGNRTHPVTKENSFHNGVDYSTFGKYPTIYCPFNGGEVLRVDKDRYGALFVYIGFKTLGYVGLAYHCSKITCKVGQKLNKDDVIGNVGSTGRSTGEHLHWSWIKYDNKWNNYYGANYVDFEKYEVKKMIVQEARKIVQDKCKLDDNTMKYLVDMYKFGDELIIKLAKAME